MREGCGFSYCYRYRYQKSGFRVKNLELRVVLVALRFGINELRITLFKNKSKLYNS